MTDETIKLVIVFKANGTHYIANFNFFEFVGDAIQPERTPALKLPEEIKTTAPTAAGGVVSYVTTATDPYDGAISATCTPASGSVFGSRDNDGQLHRDQRRRVQHDRQLQGHGDPGRRRRRPSGRNGAGHLSLSLGTPPASARSPQASHATTTRRRPPPSSAPPVTRR